jgi:hypothetical protein
LDEKRERGKNIRNIMGPMGKLYNYVVYIRSSANRTIWFIERAGKIVPLDNRMRWNSWFLMLCVALEDKVKAGLQLYVEHYEDDLKDDILSTSEWIHLRTIRDFLQSFHEATLFLQGDRTIRDFLQSFHEATLFLQGDRTTLERVLESVDVLKDMIQTALVYYTILLIFL